MDTKPKHPNRAIEIPVTHLDLIEFCLRGVSISVLNRFEKSDTEWIYQDYRSFIIAVQDNHGLRVVAFVLLAF